MVRAGSLRVRDVPAEVMLSVRVSREMAHKVKLLVRLCDVGNPYRWPRVTQSYVLRHALAVGLARMLLDLETVTELERLDEVLRGMGRR